MTAPAISDATGATQDAVSVAPMRRSVPGPTPASARSSSSGTSGTSAARATLRRVAPSVECERCGAGAQERNRDAAEGCYARDRQAGSDHLGGLERADLPPSRLEFGRRHRGETADRDADRPFGFERSRRGDADRRRDAGGEHRERRSRSNGSGVVPLPRRSRWRADSRPARRTGPPARSTPTARRRR